MWTIHESVISLIQTLLGFILLLFICVGMGRTIRSGRGADLNDVLHAVVSPIAVLGLLSLLAVLSFKKETVPESITILATNSLTAALSWKAGSAIAEMKKANGKAENETPSIPPPPVTPAPDKLP
jgi:hypothetical protein